MTSTPPPADATQSPEPPASHGGLLAQVVGVMIFSACATAGLKAGLNLSDTVILRQVYGAKRVAAEDLMIVKSTPHLLVSNGDVLEGYGFMHFLLVVPIFLAIGAGGTVCGLYALPRPMRQVFNRDGESAGGGVGCLAGLVFLVFGVTLSTGRSLWPNGAIVALAIASA